MLDETLDEQGLTNGDWKVLMIAALGGGRRAAQPASWPVAPS